MTKAISTIFIAGTIDAVWREITKTGEAQKCFFNNVMHTTGLRPGAMIQMRSISNKYVGVVGEVLAIEPPYLFSHTFKFTSYDDPYCKVTYKLREVAGGVEFTLISEDLVEGSKTAKQMTSGGEMIVKSLKGIVENGKPPFGMRVLYRIIGVTERFTPERCKVEHWPLVDVASSPQHTRSESGEVTPR